MNRAAELAGIDINKWDPGKKKGVWQRAVPVMKRSAGNDWGTDGDSAKSGEMAARIKLPSGQYLGTRMMERVGSSPAPLAHLPTQILIATGVVEKAKHKGAEAVKSMEATNYRMDMSERLLNACFFSSFPNGSTNIRHFLLPPKLFEKPIPTHYFGVAPSKPVDNMIVLSQVMSQGNGKQDTLLLFGHRAFFDLNWSDAAFEMASMSDRSMLGVGYM